MSLTYEAVAVGDEVYCLAWIGKKFTVVDKDDDKKLVALEGESASDPYGAQVDVFDETMWMITDQPWDQIWYWPDRAGEHYQEVYERWVARQSPGQIVVGSPGRHRHRGDGWVHRAESEAVDELPDRRASTTRSRRPSSNRS